MEFTRRCLFGTAVVGACSLVLAPFETAPARTLRPVYRYSYSSDTWTRVRMWQLKEGDVFHLDEVGVLLASRRPEKLPDGDWEIWVSYRFDPESNQWVPVRAE